MAAPAVRVHDVWAVVTYSDPAAELRVHDIWVESTYGGLVGIMDYVVVVVAAQVGHGRVYNRHRHTRNRAQFEALFTDTNGLEFWTVRRARTNSKRIGNADAFQEVHTIQIEGIVRHKDDAVAANATEFQLQANAELIADALRPDTTLGGLVELSWLGTTTVDDAEYAGVASHRVRLDFQAQEFTTG